MIGRDPQQEIRAEAVYTITCGYEQTYLPVCAALATLQDQYLVEPEEISQTPHDIASLPLIHIGTLMKIDLILPHTPGFDVAMQTRVSPLLIDDRYTPFPVASALEMVYPVADPVVTARLLIAQKTLDDISSEQGGS